MDVYSFCALLAYGLTGKQPPPPLDRYMAALSSEGKDTLIPPRELGVPITREQEDILLAVLAIRQKDRIQTVAELADRLGGSL